MRIIGGAAAALVLIAAILVSTTDQDAPIESYRVRDDVTIRITALGGTNWVWTRVHEVAESDTTVSVRVRSLEWPLPHGDAGVPYEFLIDLEAPLGDRRVIDGATGTDIVEIER